MLDMTTKAFAHALVSSADDGAEQVHADSVVVDEAPPEIICGDTLAVHCSKGVLDMTCTAPMVASLLISGSILQKNE